MQVWNSVVTAVVTLLAVLLGGWVSIQSQRRSAKLDSDGRWRDVRRGSFTGLLGSARQYVAYASDSAAVITPVPSPPRADVPFVVLDERGTRYREQMESSWLQVRLVAHSRATIDLAHEVFQSARAIAIARAVHGPAKIPHEAFQKLWKCEADFIRAARAELDLRPSNDPYSAPGLDVAA